jgi:hypothetical protein
LMDADEPCVGWYVSDCTVGLGFYENLHCLCLTVEPSTAKDERQGRLHPAMGNTRPCSTAHRGPGLVRQLR